MSLHARGIFVALLAVQYALHAAAVKDHGQLSPARIVVISVPAASHWFQFKAIIDELLDRGHSVQVRSGHVLARVCHNGRSSVNRTRTRHCQARHSVAAAVWTECNIATRA